MADFSVDFVGDKPGDIERRLMLMNQASMQRTNDALMESARKVKKDLERTSPVDTKTYKKSWYIYPVSYDEVWILNSADHARYVMLPNANMVGSGSADLPSQGILHNVEGVAKSHHDTLQSNMLEQFRELLQAFKR